jgi:hypothetical protein
MIQILMIIAFAIVVILLNILIICFVIPKVIRFFDKLFKGELFLSLFELLICCFILGITTLGMISLLFSLL